MSSAPHSGIINKQSSQARAVANTLKGSLGNLVEWYDVYVYTVFLKYFEPSYFGAAEKKSTLYAYAIFALTFVMRPVGSWFFGRYADRYGRRIERYIPDDARHPHKSGGMCWRQAVRKSPRVVGAGDGDLFSEGAVEVEVAAEIERSVLG